MKSKIIILMILLLIAIEYNFARMVNSIYYVKAAPSQTDIEGFEKYVLKSIECNPQNGFARMEYATRVLLARGNNEEARKQAFIASKTYNSVNAYKQIGAIYLKMSAHQNALEYLNMTNRMVPNDPMTFLKVAQIFMNIQDYNKALELFNKIINIDPNNINAFYQISIIYEKIENYMQEINYLKKILLVQKDTYEEETLNKIALIYLYKLNEIDKAILCFSALIRINDTNPDYYRKLYICYQKLGDKIQTEKISKIFREKYHININE